MKAADAYHKVRDNWQQAQQWLADSSAPVGEGSEAVRKVIQAGQEAALLLPQKERQELQEHSGFIFCQFFDSKGFKRCVFSCRIGSNKTHSFSK